MKHIDLSHIEIKGLKLICVNSFHSSFSGRDILKGSFAEFIEFVTSYKKSLYIRLKVDNNIFYRVTLKELRKNFKVYRCFKKQFTKT